MLPILEHLGLRVVDEVPHVVRVRAERQRTVMIHDFGLETQSGGAIVLSELANRFREAWPVWDEAGGERPAEFPRHPPASRPTRCGFCALIRGTFGRSVFRLPSVPRAGTDGSSGVSAP